MFSDFIKKARNPIDIGKYELMEMFRTYRNQIEEIGKDANDMDEEYSDLVFTATGDRIFNN